MASYAPEAPKPGPADAWLGFAGLLTYYGIVSRPGGGGGGQRTLPFEGCTGEDQT